MRTGFWTQVLLNWTAYLSYINIFFIKIKKIPKETKILYVNLQNLYLPFTF